jgi:hypothetical protein
VNGLPAASKFVTGVCRYRREGFTLDLMTHQPVKMSYFSVARRSFQAGGQRGSLYLIAA